MLKENINRSNALDSIRPIIIRLTILLFFIFGITTLIYRRLIINIDMYHTVLELACVFIAFSIFASVWYTYYVNNICNQMLGFGYLAAGIFNIFHIYYYFKLDLNTLTYFDLSTKFCMIGRLTEAIVLFLVMHSVKISVENKWKSLSITLIITIGISYFVVGYFDFLPVLLTENGVAKTKIILEYIVILLYIVSIFRIKDKLFGEKIVAYKYILASLFLNIIAEVCFILYLSANSFEWAVGHILKLSSYFYLFRGVFISTVTYPYNELEIKNNQLEQTNDQLKNVSTTLTDLLDALPIGVANYNENGRLKYINKKIEDLLGCNREELYGLTREEAVDILSYDNGPLNDRIFENDVKNVIRQYKKSNGDIVKLSVTSKRIANGVLMLLSDTKKEQQLEDMHIQTETILDAVNNCILIFNTDKKVILCNKALEELFEMNRDNIIDKDINELGRLMNFKDCEFYDLALKGQKMNNFNEVSFTSLSGKNKQLLIHLEPIRNIEGEIIGAISISTDITDLKKEQHLQQQKEKLALLGQLSACILHETKNFLAIIKGSSQLLNVVAKDEKVRKYANKIDSATNEVNNIVNNFLALGKPNPKVISEVSLNEIVIDIEGILKSSALISGAKCKTYLHSNNRILCDRDQIKQVVLNICKNAIEAMSDTKEPRLIIETGENSIADEVFIKISDNGKGISSEEMGKLGKPFFTTKELGTGLGLNICFKIIKEHSGKIEIESEIGYGTTFIITLPKNGSEEKTKYNNYNIA